VGLQEFHASSCDIVFAMETDLFDSVEDYLGGFVGSELNRRQFADQTINSIAGCELFAEGEFF
jgi:hypothetical protein